MRKYLSLVAALMLFASCAAPYVRPLEGQLQSFDHLAVVILGEPDFKVLNHRATDLGPGVLFGAVGAIANSAYTNSMDAGLQKKMKPLASQISYRENFETQLKDFLDQSRRFQRVDFYHEKKEAPLSPGAAVLELSIQEWGLKLIDQKGSDLVPFIHIEIKLTDAKGKALWKESSVEVGRLGHAFEAYRNQQNLLQETLQRVLRDTASRISSTLIYS